MKVVVCVTQVLEVPAYLEFTADGTSIDPAFVTGTLNEADQNAIEEALALRETAGGDGEIVLVNLGDDGAEAALRAGLVMGADRAVRVAGDGLETADIRTVAKALAQVVAAEQPDLVLTGVQAADTGSQSTGPAVAEAWGVPWVPVARSLSVQNGALTATREFEAGVSEQVTVGLPALATIQVGANEPRYGSFKDKMRAKKAEIPVITPTGLPEARTVLAKMTAAEGGGRSVEMVEGGPAAIAARILEIIREVQS
jgi:electron transfer flavoprotein beta subunit